MAFTAQEVQRLQDLANRLRIDSVTSTQASKSGHPTSCASMAEIVSVLFFNVMRYSTKAPKHPAHDRFVLSKGHAAPILYAAWAEAGLFPVEQLNDLRKLSSDLEGHPTPRLNFVDVATGSLGQGLNVAAGMAYVGKYIDQVPFRTYCLLGDGESAEGSVWEAFNFASLKKLDNLVAIIDVNRLGQSEETAFQHDTQVYADRATAFGWQSIVVDGHNVEELLNAFTQAAATKGRPTAIIARTFKGKGFPCIEDKLNWHGKALGDQGEAVVAHLQQQLGGRTPANTHPDCDFQAPESDLSKVRLSEPPNYPLGQKIATRFAYGTALVKLGLASDRVIALDADTKNSTYSDAFNKQFPGRFVECYIAEQNLVGVAIGAGCRGRTVPFVSTFAAFFTRAADHLRMAAISQANIKLVGSHCGVSIGEDGPSQMALEDLALFRTIPGSHVYYPSDAVSTERAVELAGSRHGIDFIRTSRPATAVLYTSETVFTPGKAHVVKQTVQDRVLLIGAGITLHESLAASELLAAQGIAARVLDPFTIKPLDVEAVVSNARAVGGFVVVTEDHYPQGGLGEAVSSALAANSQPGDNFRVEHLAIRELPRSGQPDELVAKYGINAQSIVAAVQRKFQ